MKRRLCLLPFRSRRAGVMPLTGTAMCTRPVNTMKTVSRDMCKQQCSSNACEAELCTLHMSSCFLGACLTALIWKDNCVQSCACRGLQHMCMQNQGSAQHSNKTSIGIAEESRHTSIWFGLGRERMGWSSSSSSSSSRLGSGRRSLGRSSGAALQVLRSLWQLVLPTCLAVCTEPVCLHCIT